MGEYRFDFYKKFRLEKPISGLVKRITSSKGSRSQEGDGYVYRLKTELCGIYGGEAMSLAPGMYHVLCICKPEGHPIWNHYLFIIEDDGTVYPVAEYLNQTDSLWVKEAIGLVKCYFSGDTLDPIDLTQYEHEEVKKTDWKSSRK